MGKRVLPGRVCHFPHETHHGCGVEHVEEVSFGGSGRSGEEVKVEVASDHRADRQRARRRIAEAHDPATDHLTDTVGQTLLIEAAFGHPPARRILGDCSGLDQMA